MDNKEKIDIDTLRPMRVIDMTGEQVEKLVEAVVQNTIEGLREKDNGFPEYVYGLSGLAKLLGCSDATAGRLKKSGKIDEAISQVGKTIVVNTRKVIELTRTTKKRKTA